MMRWVAEASAELERQAAASTGLVRIEAKITLREHAAGEGAGATIFIRRRHSFI